MRIVLRLVDGEYYLFFVFVVENSIGLDRIYWQNVLAHALCR